MADRLTNARILVLEDNYYLAMDIARALTIAGADVVGPFSDQAAAQSAVGDRSPDAALLDVNTGGRPSFTLARQLAAAGVPFAFVTGYDRAAIPAEFALVVRCEKPVEAEALVAMVCRLLHTPAVTPPRNTIPPNPRTAG